MLESLINKVKKETPIQLFSCEYFKKFKNTYFEEYLQTPVGYSIKNVYSYILPIF